MRVYIYKRIKGNLLEACLNMIIIIIK